MLIVKESSGKILARSDADLISLGREDDNTIRLETESISGYHGVFLNIQGAWIYRDNFSTNGSYYNGISLRPGQSKLIKNGDLIRLVSYPIQCELKTESGSNFVLVMKGFEPISKFQLPEQSSTLIIDSSIVPEFYSSSITLNRSQEGVLSVSSNDEIVINGNAHKGKMTLIDQDQVEVGDFSFLICYTSLPSKASRNIPERVEYDPSKKLAESGKRVVFGGGEDNKYEERKSSGYRAEVSMSQKLATIADDEATKKKNKVERMYAAFGVLVLFTTVFFFASLISLF